MSDTGDRSQDSGEATAKETTKSRKKADKRRRDRIELFAAALIGIAAVLTAIATFQGGQIDGKVAEKQTEILGLSLAANDAYNDANAQQAIERDWIFGWITAFENGEPAAEYLAEAMPPAVFDLADEWANAPDDISDPFSEEAAQSYDSYGLLPSTGLLVLGDLRLEVAECATFTAQVFDRQGESYGLSTVFLAIALVVGGIAALLKRALAQYIVLGTAVVSLIVGAFILAFGADEDEARNDVAPEFYSSLFDEEIPADEAIALADEVCPRS